MPMPPPKPTTGQTDDVPGRTSTKDPAISDMTESPAHSGAPTIDTVTASAYSIPTDQPEGDGTLAWDKTTMVCVTVAAGGMTGLGWTYAPPATAHLVEEMFGPQLRGRPALAIAAIDEGLRVMLRNAGVRGLVSYALSAVDVALWDLKAQLLGVSLADLLGPARSDVPVYGSGGFTTYDAKTLERQVRGWLSEGVGAVKIKIAEDAGGDVAQDLRRVEQVRGLIGADTELFVDANGGYSRKQAVRVGRVLDDHDVHWFEEPVSSQDKDGLAEIRALLDLDIAAGEYADELPEVRRLCEVVDCLQLDATRCGGISGWLRGAAVAAAHGLEVSGHCAPYVHLAVAAATPNFRHLERFHDHVRIEQRFLEGTQELRFGVLRADAAQLGHGFRLKSEDLAPYRVA